MRMRPWESGTSSSALPTTLALHWIILRVGLRMLLRVSTKASQSCGSLATSRPSLQAIQQENPEADVLFIFGGDKLSGLPGWRSYEALVSQFKIILFSRGDSDLLEVIENTPALAAHAGSFVILRSPEGLDGISSTAVRERLRSGKHLEDMLTYEVSAMLLAEKNRKENAI